MFPYRKTPEPPSHASSSVAISRYRRSHSHLSARSASLAFLPPTPSGCLVAVLAVQKGNPEDREPPPKSVFLLGDQIVGEGGNGNLGGRRKRNIFSGGIFTVHYVRTYYLKNLASQHPKILLFLNDRLEKILHP